MNIGASASFRHLERWRFIAGVVDTTTNNVEQPETVAERIERVTVGDPRRVMAGTDCGFETTAALAEVAEENRLEETAFVERWSGVSNQRLLR